MRGARVSSGSQQSPDHHTCEPAAIHRIELLRHAKSSWDDPGLADRERPLARRGVKATARLREHLRRSGIAPDLVLCSPAARAVETWERVRDGLAGDMRVGIEAELYAASADQLLARLGQLPESAGSVLVIGHNPGIGELAEGELRLPLE